MSGKLDLMSGPNVWRIFKCLAVCTTAAVAPQAAVASVAAVATLPVQIPPDGAKVQMSG